MKLTSSHFVALAELELARSELGYRQANSDTASHDKLIEDISDMQLEHALALQEQVRELELESEEE